MSDAQRIAGAARTIGTTVLGSGNLSIDGTLNASAIRAELDSALAAAAGSEASVRTRNAGTISAAVLQSLAGAADAAGKTAVLHADTMSADNSAVQGRLYVEPAKLTGLIDALRLGVYTQSDRTGPVKKLFEQYFAGSVAVIAFDQQGALGARLRVAASVELEGMDVAGLVFYSYDISTNSYTQIVDPAYFIDANGYLHFHTRQGGYVIVSCGPLR